MQNFIDPQTERWALEEIVRQTADAIIVGQLSPLTPSHALIKIYKRELRNTAQATAVMAQACKIAAEEAGAVCAVMLNSTGEFLGQFAHGAGLTDADLKAEVSRVVASNSDHLEKIANSGEREILLNIERLPQYNFTKEDTEYIELYGEHYASCKLTYSS